MNKKPGRTARLTILGSMLLAGSLVASPRSGQEPALRPIDSYVPAIADGELGALRYFARRCAALFTVTSGLLETGDRIELAAQYEEAAGRYYSLASQVEMEMGSSEPAAASATAAAVQEIGSILIERLRRNMALTGSYFSDDPLISGDITACSYLAETLPRF